MGHCKEDCSTLVLITVYSLCFRVQMKKQKLNWKHTMPRKLLVSEAFGGRLYKNPAYGGA